MPPKPHFFLNQQNPSEQRQPLQTTRLPRLLCLKGQNGTLACRVYDPLAANFFPQRSEPWGRLKYAWLSEEKMHNLIAVRGHLGASMVGPADYFCDLERSDQFLYTIALTSERVPVFTQYPLHLHQDEQSIPPSSKTISDELLTKVNAKWFSGTNKKAISAKKAEYRNHTNPMFGDSLFQSSGILEIEGPKEIKLHAFDPRGVNLSAFKARLVSNDVPFQITAERLAVDDEYCAVSYHFDEGYAEEQIKKGGGVFLEFHTFAQTITPLDQNSRGFVTLAKWNEVHTQLELIAIEIPYGYTLIIEKDCIHGDTTLNGLFMMCMTADHISMATADTVFLKHAASKKNISLTLDIIPKNDHQRPNRILDPLVFFKESKNDDFAYFNTRTQGMSFVFTPFNRGYWEVKQPAMNTVAHFVLLGLCLSAAILLLESMLALSLALFSASAILLGVGLYRVLTPSEPLMENDLVLNGPFVI